MQRPTMLEALKRIQKEIRQYGQGKVLHGKRTLKELAKFVRTFNNSGPEELLLRRLLIGTLMHAVHIGEIRIPNMGAFESQSQSHRNGPMIPGPRTTKIELDFDKHQLNILRHREKEWPLLHDVWLTERVIPLEKIKKIRIVRVPAGLRHLEIELHSPCPD